MLVKCALTQYITKVDMNEEGMIWMKLSVCSGITIGGVYKPPKDSLYYNPSLFGAINAQCVEDSVVMLGDFNARVGSPRFIDDCECVVEYSNVKDLVENTHGLVLLSICENNEFLVANHLSHNGQILGGESSFKRSDTWLSEIDLCVVKSSFVTTIRTLDVNQNITGSDHAPLYMSVDTRGRRLMTSSMLMKPAEGLGESYSRIREHDALQKSPKYETLDLNAFTEALENRSAGSYRHHLGGY